eukprot:gene11991-14167_t
MPGAMFPTAAGAEAGRWCPTGSGSGIHLAPGEAPAAGGREDKKAAKAAEKAAKAAEKAAKDKAKLIKTVEKEGGKKGVEIAGAADLGGLEFFCCNMMLVGGSVEMLKLSMAAMNKESDPSEEEMKGGSGHVGKMIFSATAEDVEGAGVAFVAYVPDSLKEKVDVKDWANEIITKFPPTAEIVEEAPNVIAGFVKSDPDNGRFLLKDKDNLLPIARDYLKSKNAIPQVEQDSDDDMEWANDAEDEIEW